MQTDLFGSNVLTPSQTRTSNAVDFLEKYRFSLRLDHALVSLIGLVVIYVLVFSFGVEQGKRFAVAELKAERAKRELLVEQVRDKIFAAAPAAAPVPGVMLEAKKPEAPVLAAAQVMPATAATTAVPVVAAAAPTGKPAGKFTIQMVTFTSKQMAERTMQGLAALGHQPFTIPSGKFHQICLNGFETKEQAGQALTELRAKGIVPKDAFVRPIPQAA